VQVYKVGSDIEKTRQYVVDSIIENYRAMEYTLKDPPTRSIQFKLDDKLIDGTEIKTLRNNVTYVDHLYFWQEKKQVVGIVLQFELTDSVAAFDYSNHIMTEIKLKTSSK